MKPVVYLDVVLLINLVVDYIILFLSVRLLGKKPVWWRILLGSLLGSIYAVGIFIPQIQIFYTFPAKLLMSVLLMLVCVRVKQIGELLRATLLFFIVSFLFGGCVLAVFTLLGHTSFNQILAENVAITVDFPYKAFVFAIAAGILLFQFFHAYFKRKKQLQACLLTAQIVCRGRTADVPVLADTGCSLRDPYSRLPVLIVELAALEGVLTPETIHACRSYYQAGKVEDFDLFSKLKMKLVPYDALGLQNGVLLCVRPDTVTVEKDGAQETVACLLGLYPHAFSDGAYRAIIGYHAVYKEEGEGVYAKAL